MGRGEADELEGEGEGGELLMLGTTEWKSIGSRKNVGESLSLPTRLAALQGVQVARVAAGCGGAHVLALDVAGKVYAWGRNDLGQLGLGFQNEGRTTPSLVKGLPAGQPVIAIAAGKKHSAAVTAGGHSFLWGSNANGQLGTGSCVVKKNHVDCKSSPVAAKVATKVTAVACGAEFSLWLCGGDVFSAGTPEHGVLGHGADLKYIERAGREVFPPQPDPRLVAGLSKISKICCGSTHSLAVTEEGHVFSWGSGSYGKLGHKEQKDEFRPRRIEVFKDRFALPPDALIACGDNSSFATVYQRQLMFWGKMMNTSEATMYPKHHQGLSGWTIRHIDCGFATAAVCAEESSVSWGQAHHQELGYGPKGKKTAAQPALMDSMEGIRVNQVAAGAGNMFLLVDRKDIGKLEKFETLDPDEPSVADMAAASKGGGAKGAKRKAAPAKKGKKATGKKARG